MTHLAGPIAVGAVSLLLVWTLAVQIWTPRGRFRLLEPVALTPQWKFFGQSVLQTPGALSDIHLLVRDRMEDGALGQWQPVMSPGERRLGEAFWNPGSRSRRTLSAFAEYLAFQPGAARDEHVQVSLPYLALLRHCLAHAPRPERAESRQFALVLTSGRSARSMSVAFVSAFHRW